MSQSNKFELYQQLLAKIDQKSDETMAKFADQMTCARGCFGCCRSGLSVNKLEADHIGDYIQRNGVLDSLVPHNFGEDFCNFLNDRGECQIYEVRPIVCRTHGLPTAYITDLQQAGHEALEPQQGPLVKDVCPLNFKTMDLNDLEMKDFVRLDTVMTILSRLVSHYVTEMSRVCQTKIFEDERLKLDPSTFHDWNG